MADKKVKVTLVKGLMGTKQDHRATVRRISTWGAPSRFTSAKMSTKVLIPCPLFPVIVDLTITSKADAKLCRTGPMTLRQAVGLIDRNESINHHACAR